jgi:dolichol kinase
LAVPSPRDELAKACRTAQATGVMLLACLGLYAIVIALIQRTHAPFSGFVPAAPRDLLRAIFAAVALASLGIIRVVQRPGLANAALPLIGRLLTAAVVALSLCESVAIYGFVLFIIGGRAIDYYIFATLALVGFARFFPRQEAWRELASTMARDEAAKRR